ERHDDFVTLAEKHGVELASVGRTGGDTIEVAGQLSIPVAELKVAWQATLPDVLGAHLA
ncbi:MAG: phosphoribosylformylglycinamidine synthase subunit PurL, partial [Aeromicrobium sp.]|nr:phosphoribosylformylglycinamidine synthase subunit PurL [Aeromicrobium sp.]